MSLYVDCQTCRGKGHFECEACICKTCQRTTRVVCPKCKQGVIPCTTCAETGKVAKKGLIFTRQEKCAVCRGTGRKICNTCNGNWSIICSACNGKGRYSSCSKCRGSNQITCQHCKGVGKFEGEWLKSIKQMSVEKLRFEHEKKHFELTNLQMRYAQLDRRVDEIQSYPMDAPLAGFWEDLDNTQKRIYEAESALNAIEQILDSKWK